MHSSCQYSLRISAAGKSITMSLCKLTFYSCIFIIHWLACPSFHQCPIIQTSRCLSRSPNDMVILKFPTVGFRSTLRASSCTCPFWVHLLHFSRATKICPWWLLNENSFADIYGFLLTSCHSLRWYSSVDRQSIRKLLINAVINSVTNSYWHCDNRGQGCPFDLASTMTFWTR